MAAKHSHRHSAPRPFSRQLADLTGLALLGIYIAWNAWWLAQARIPPALMKAITGLPAPTSGGTRSAMQLLQGNVAASLYYNPMTVPICLLLALTLFQVLRRGVADAWLAPAWSLLLLIAWLLKLASPTATW